MSRNYRRSERTYGLHESPSKWFAGHIPNRSSGLFGLHIGFPEYEETIPYLSLPRQRSHESFSLDARESSRGRLSDITRRGLLTSEETANAYATGEFARLPYPSCMMPTSPPPLDPPPFHSSFKLLSLSDDRSNGKPALSEDFDDSFTSSQYLEDPDTSLNSTFSDSSPFPADQDTDPAIFDPFGLNTHGLNGDASASLRRQKSSRSTSNAKLDHNRSELRLPGIEARPQSKKTSMPLPSFGYMSLFDESELDGSLTPESSITRRRRPSSTSFGLDGRQTLSSAKRQRDSSTSMFRQASRERLVKRNRLASGVAPNGITSLGDDDGLRGRSTSTNSTFPAYKRV